MLKPSLCWLTEPSHLTLPWSAQPHMMSTVLTSLCDRSGVVLFPYSGSILSGGTLFTGMQRHTESRPPSRSQSAFLFLLLFCNATHYPKAFALPALPWEQKEKLQLHCSIKNLFITRWISHTKNIEYLWCCYRPWTDSCQAACAIFLSCWQPFFCNASFLLMQPLTGRHPAAPVLDKVKTRVGVDWLVDPYLIKDSISLSLSVCRRGPASSCFLCLLDQNLPPWESRQAACCWVTK